MKSQQLEKFRELEKILATATIKPELYAAVTNTDVMTVYGALRRGEIEGAFRMGRHWKIPTVPLLRKLGLAPEAA